MVEVDCSTVRGDVDDDLTGTVSQHEILDLVLAVHVLYRIDLSTDQVVHRRSMTTMSVGL